MSNRTKKRLFPPVPRRQKVNLDAQDISGTGIERSSSDQTKDGYDDIIEAPPPFKGERKDRFVSLSDISITYKVAGFFFVVVTPIIIFFSRMESKVENIENDVKDIKQTTQNLTETSIKNSTKIDNFEKIIDKINYNSLPNTQNNGYHIKQDPSPETSTNTKLLPR